MNYPTFSDVSAAARAIRLLKAKLEQLNDRPDSPGVRYRRAFIPKLIGDAEEQEYALFDEALDQYLERRITR
jgi:hypothetical protein